jgi:hypothetical protein
LAPTIQSSIYKVDFDGVSITFDIDDVAYLVLAELADKTYPLKLDIHLRSNVSNPICITASEDGRAELQNIYLNLYTKWRNFDKEYKMATTLAYGNYDE